MCIEPRLPRMRPGERFAYRSCRPLKDDRRFDTKHTIGSGI
jgi:hypothetical protein